MIFFNPGRESNILSPWARMLLSHPGLKKVINLKGFGGEVMCPCEKWKTPLALSGREACNVAKKKKMLLPISLCDNV